MEQVEKTETSKAIAREVIFLAQARLTVTTRQPWNAAQNWIVGDVAEREDERERKELI